MTNIQTAIACILTAHWAYMAGWLAHKERSHWDATIVWIVGGGITYGMVFGLVISK